MLYVSYVVFKHDYTQHIIHLFSLRIGICSAQIGRLHWCRQLGYHSDKGRLISTVVHLYKGRGVENRHSAPR